MILPRAVALPMPALAPVTTTVLPSSLTFELHRGPCANKTPHVKKIFKRGNSHENGENVEIFFHWSGSQAFVVPTYVNTVCFKTYLHILDTFHLIHKIENVEIWKEKEETKSFTARKKPRAGSACEIRIYSKWATYRELWATFLDRQDSNRGTPACRYRTIQY